MDIKRKTNIYRFVIMLVFIVAFISIIFSQSDLVFDSIQDILLHRERDLTDYLSEARDRVEANSIFISSNIESKFDNDNGECYTDDLTNFEDINAYGLNGEDSSINGNLTGIGFIDDISKSVIVEIRGVLSSHKSIEVRDEFTKSYFISKNNFMFSSPKEDIYKSRLTPSVYEKPSYKMFLSEKDKRLDEQLTTVYYEAQENAISVGSPVYAGGQFIGGVFIDISASQIKEIIAKYFVEGDSGETIVACKDGKIIASSSERKNNLSLKESGLILSNRYAHVKIDGNYYFSKKLPDAELFVMKKLTYVQYLKSLLGQASSEINFLLVLVVILLVLNEKDYIDGKSKKRDRRNAHILNQATEKCDTYIWRISLNDKKVHINKDVAERFGYKNGHIKETKNGSWIVNRNFLLDNYIHSDSVETVKSALNNVLKSEGETLIREIKLYHYKDGGKNWSWFRGYAFLLDRDIIITVVDITKEKQSKHILDKITKTDTLTGAKNRFMLEEEFEVNGFDNKIFAFIDINKFKDINDFHGHRMGDWLLIRLSKILTCGGRFDVYRVAGDEFAVVSDTDTDLNTFINLITGIEKTIVNEEFDIEIRIDISVGIFEIGKDSSLDLNTIFLFADKAMYVSKNRNTKYVVCTDDFKDRLAIEKEERNTVVKAIKDGEFEPIFIPIHSVKEKKIESVKIAIAFKDNVIAPNLIDILRIAGNNQLVRMVSEKIFADVNKSIRDNKQSKLLIGKIDIEFDFTAENLTYFEQQKDQWEYMFSEGEIAPDKLTLVVSEKVILADRAAETLNIINQFGVKVVYGEVERGDTMVKALISDCITTVKLSEKLLPKDKNDIKKLKEYKHIVEMIHAVGKKVCAIGVKTKEQIEILNELSVEQVSSYYNEPMIFEKLIEVLAKID